MAGWFPTARTSPVGGVKSNGSKRKTSGAFPMAAAVPDCGDSIKERAAALDWTLASPEVGAAKYVLATSPPTAETSPVCGTRAAAATRTGAFPDAKAAPLEGLIASENCACTPEATADPVPGAIAEVVVGAFPVAATVVDDGDRWRASTGASPEALMLAPVVRVRLTDRGGTSPVALMTAEATTR